MRSSSGTLGAAQRGGHLVHARGQLGEDPAAQQVAHVRRDRDQRRPVGDGEPRELDRLVEVGRPVVDVRQQVEVELDLSQGPSTVTDDQPCHTFVKVR